MEPRVILVKPSYLPALPAYEGWMRRVRVMLLATPLYAVALVGLFVYTGLGAMYLVFALVPTLLALAYLMRMFARARAREAAIMAGEQPVVVADEVDAGFELLPGDPRRRRIGLAVFPGDEVTVTVERARDPRRGPTRLLPYMNWRFENGDWRPLVVGTYFDPDRALLRDVEARLRSLGATVEITHTPFDDAS